MNVEMMERIKRWLEETAPTPAHGVRETPAPFISFEHAADGRPPPGLRPLDEEERALIRRELRELGEAAARMPRVTDMTDDEILGYDEQ